MGLMMWIWLGIFVIMILAEAATSVSLTSIWFALGALVGILAAGLGAPIWAQIICCVATGMITIATLRPYMKKKIAPKVVKSGLECLIGETAVVTEEVSKTRGAVTVNGAIWTARTHGEPISVESECTILEMDGIKLIVSTNTAE
jgi:membrane protein implicated in regulation of membrane protease activity